jgi:ribonuclease VapC
MVVDASAVLAILFEEPDSDAISKSILEAGVRLISAATVLEAGIVVESRFGSAGSADLDELIRAFELVVTPVTQDQVHTGREAFRRFGKGRHAAALNFGDCFSYALAHITGEPLLFKGNDFSLTDIRTVPLTK